MTTAIKRMGYTMLIAIVWQAFPTCAANWYVKMDGNDAGAGSTWSSAKFSVQGALAVASSGDEIWVASGSYSGGFTLPSGVSLYGGFSGTELFREQRNGTLNPTILSGGGAAGSVVTVPADASGATTLDSFVVQNGVATQGGGVFCGPCSAPRICQNVIRQNTAVLQGGGIYCAAGSTPLISGNAISYNMAGSDGGGIACEESAPVITNNTAISGNQAQRGGGIACRGSNATPVVSGNQLQTNVATERGGGFFLSDGAAPEVLGNQIVANRASHGGGLSADQSTARIERNTLGGNLAQAGNGGALDLRTNATLRLIGNLFAGNSASASGGALYFGPGATSAAINNTIADNTAQAGEGGGICLDGASPGLTNNLIAFNSSGIRKASADTPGIVCNDVALNTAYDYAGFATDPTGHAGNLSTNPLFVARLSGNYHLDEASPCREAGTNAAVASTWLDIDSEFRIQSPDNGTVDIGYDEVHTGRSAQPTFMPDGGTFDDPVSVTVSPVTAGSVVHYTTDGATPDETSPVIDADAPLMFTADTTLKARAYLAGWEPSEIASATYAFSRVATPAFSPGQGRYESPLAVTVTCATVGATIHWTTNGVDPTVADPVVASGAAVTLDTARLLKARAWKDPLTPSRVMSAGYALDVLFVNKPGGSVQDGLSWETAFGTIQAALDVAATGTSRRVWVAAYKPGGGASAPYFEHLEMPSVGELMGGFLGTEYAPEQRIPSWRTNAEVIVHGNWVQGVPTVQECGTGSLGPVRIDSLTIMGGCGEWGGGISYTYKSRDLEVAHCLITQNGYFYDADWNVKNYTSKGGGVCIAFTDGDSGWIHDCQVDGNYGFRGGGVYATASVLIEDSSISGNTAWGYGGGVNHGGAPYVRADTNNDGYEETIFDPHACVRNCVIKGNTCSWPGQHSGEGGGLALMTGDQGVLVFDNAIEVNEARLSGGGIACIDANAIVAGNRIVENFLRGDPEYGAGVYIYDSLSDYSSSFVNNYVYKNNGPFPACGGGFAMLGYGWCPGVDAPNVSLRNNRIIKNTAGYSGGGVFLQALYWYLHCNFNTVSDNVTPTPGTEGYELDFLPYPPDDPQPTGKLFMSGDIVAPAVLFDRLPWTNTIAYNDVGQWIGITNQYGINGNISVDPGFIASEPAPSYRIAPGSPVEDTVPNLFKVGEVVTPGQGSAGVTNDVNVYVGRYPVEFYGMRSFHSSHVGFDMDLQQKDGVRFDMGADEINYCKIDEFWPPAGDVTPTNVLVSSQTPGVTIRYTLDGREPALGDSEVLSGGAVTVAHAGWLKAKAFWTADQTLWPSRTMARFYGVQGLLLLVH